MSHQICVQSSIENARKVIRDSLAQIDRARKTITDSLAEIDRATKIISDNQTQVPTLIDQHVQPVSLSTQASLLSPNDSNEDDNSDHPNSTASNLVHNVSGGNLPCPDCDKEYPNLKALKRHHETHVILSDEWCVCCGESIRRASNFNKFHAGCLKRMGGQLSKGQRKEASKQNRRIKEAKGKAFERAMKDKESERESEKGVEEMSRNVKRVRHCGDDEPSPKRRMDADAPTLIPRHNDSVDGTCSPANMNSYGAAVDPSFLPNVETGSNRTAMFPTQPRSYEQFDPVDIRFVTDIHGVTTGSSNFNDGFYRGPAMVLNPMDGVVDWDILNV